RNLPLDEPASFLIGGHEIRKGDFVTTAREFQQRSNIFSHELVEACRPELESWAKNIRPGTIINSGETIGQLCNWKDVPQNENATDAIQRIGTDIKDFQLRNKLDQVAVINISSTEPAWPLEKVPDSLAKLELAWSNKNKPSPLPASSLYAWAAVENG